MILFSAKYMLDVIGAGVTATCEQDWHEIWKASPEANCVEEEIDIMGHNRMVTA